MVGNISKLSNHFSTQEYGITHFAGDSTLVFHNIVRLCTVFNSSVNVIIYCLAARQFRRELINLFLKLQNWLQYNIKVFITFQGKGDLRS